VLNILFHSFCFFSVKTILIMSPSRRIIPAGEAAPNFFQLDFLALTPVIYRNANNGSFPIQKHGKRALLNGLDPMTEEEAANIIIGEAQRLLENDMEALKLGLGETKAMKTV
jgi:hypothetical protein